MTDDEQQEVFSREMEKRMDQLCDELDIDCIFILGWLQRMQWRVQQEMDFAETEEDMRRESGNGDETVTE
jgi:hypothetical protein